MFITMTALSNGYFTVSDRDARKVSGGVPPKAGYEKLVEYQGGFWWVGRTAANGKASWYMRESGGWRLENGVAVLGRTS